MDVEIRDLETQKTMFVRHVIKADALGDAFMTTMPRVFEYAKAEAAGHIFGRYHEFTPERVDVEIGMQVKDHLPAEGDIEPGEIPGGRYAIAIHIGPYDGLPATYDAVYTWIHDNGHRDIGPPFEAYVDDPSTTPPERLRTEVCVPIE